MTSLISRLQEKIDLQHTCGYITLVNFPKRIIRPVTEKGDAKREPSPSVGDKMDLQLLEEELDNIDSPMAGMSTSTTTASTTKLRPKQLSLSVTSESSRKDLADDWKLMDVTYGIPLFDLELNCDITNKILEGDLVAKESLKSLKETSETAKEGVLEFIKDNSITVPDWLMDNDVPFPTNPVWFDGTSIKPLGRIYNR